MRDIRNIVVLTGAGVSAESGLATFRGPDGLWEGHRVEDVCTPQALARDPALVHAFYDARRAKLAEVRPNAAHRALARLDAEWPGELLIVTQNVDDLHERAGAKRLLHMHGELKSALCGACGERYRWTGPMSARPERSRGAPAPSQRPSTSFGTSEPFEAPRCPSCDATKLRPDIVFFGEMPYQMDRIDAALSRADLFVSIGTSGAVYPAAGFVQIARHHGARTLELNLEPSVGSYMFSESRMGPAGELVPAWVEEVLKSSPSLLGEGDRLR
ncbi:NAD-dependent deacylase [Sphingomonas sp.]|uniref:NAD-dependent deacylase n=1 Tax=Sphingomonas sp. TaxID=28214 RepID=UPI002DB979E9|nr:NAD-dependent deacylase [Sphingomonas sp.]HEU4968566.1 NAD-dependent deacylase [Sphingomonas sp.]